MATETVSIRVAVPRLLHREFKAATAADGTTMTRVILVAIAAYLEQRRKREREQAPWREPADA